MTRIFQLHRYTDITGASGTGIVAVGDEFPDGIVVIRWRGQLPSTVIWEDIAHAQAIHAHGGATEFVWLDGDGRPTGTRFSLVDEAEQQLRFMNARSRDEAARLLESWVRYHQMTAAQVGQVLDRFGPQ